MMLGALLGRQIRVCDWNCLGTTRVFCSTSIIPNARLLVLVLVKVMAAGVGCVGSKMQSDAMVVAPSAKTLKSH
jgi:hypothetical protein